MTRFDDTLTSTSIAKERFDCSGGGLQIEKCGVILTLPRGSVEEQGLNIYLSVCHQDKDRPTLTEHQTLLSPVVQFGPKGLKLKAPAMITLPHCADIDQGTWRLRLLAKDVSPIDPNDGSQVYGSHSVTLMDDQKCSSDNIHIRESTLERTHWKELFILDSCFNIHERRNVYQSVEHSRDEDISYELNKTSLLLFTRAPRCYCLIGETLEHRLSTILLKETTLAESSRLYNRFDASSENRAIKLLQVAAFSSPIMPSTMDYSTRVYVLSDTEDALKYVTQVESQSDGLLIDHIRHVPFADIGIAMTFQIVELSKGWRNRLQTEKQEIPFRHIWNGTQTSTLHCSFSLENTDPKEVSAYWKIVFYQASPKHGQWYLCSSKN